MANVKAIYQPLVATHTHASSLNSLLKSPETSQLTLSTGYVNAAGVTSISSALSSVADKTRVFVGIRNGASTAQGLSKLLEAGASVFVVDTATRHRIFHPKAYIAKGAETARVILGSANLTHAGLFNNIEVGADISLNLTDADDAQFLSDLEDTVLSLPVAHPANCYPVSSGRQIVELIELGLVEDERDQKTSSAFGVSKSGSANGVKPAINLPTTKAPKTGVRRRRRATSSASTASNPPDAGPVANASKSSMPHLGALLWQKPKLPRGDLQLLNQGHGSGALRLTQAGFKVAGQKIDQTQYFRYTVFKDLTWETDPGATTKEMAHATFSLVIEGIYIGDFNLKITHNPEWESSQNNYTTHLHWSKVQQIRREDLVERTLNLYEPAIPGNPFILEID